MTTGCHPCNPSSCNPPGHYAMGAQRPGGPPDVGNLAPALAAQKHQFGTQMSQSAGGRVADHIGGSSVKRTAVLVTERGGAFGSAQDGQQCRPVLRVGGAGQRTARRPVSAGPGWRPWPAGLGILSLALTP